MGRLELVQTLSKHAGRVWNVAWHPNDEVFASCGEDKTIRIWAKEGENWVNKIILTDGHKRTIRQVSWSPCGNYLASASFDATVTIWDKKYGELECNTTLEGHENEVKSVAWSRSGQLLATCSRDKSVWIWEVADDDEYECGAVLNAHTQDVKKVMWNPHKDVVASASYDNTVKMFREDNVDHDWCCVSTLSSHESTVWSLAFDETGTRLATCSDDCTVKIWREYAPGNAEQIATPDGESVWKCTCTLSGQHTRAVYDVAWCRLTGLLATAAGDDSVRVFSEVPGSDPNQPEWVVAATCDRAHAEDVNCVAWSPSQPGLLASAGDDGHVKLWAFHPH